MFLKNVRYKNKILILFIPVFVIMAAGLYIVYSFYSTSLLHEHSQRLDRTAQLTNDSMDRTQLEMMKLVNLFQVNRNLIEYLYISTDLGGEKRPLVDMMKPLFTALDIDLLELFDDKGRNVIRLDKITGDTTENSFTAADHIGDLPRSVRRGFTKENGILILTAAGPLRDDMRTIGYISVGKYLDGDYVKELEDISGNRIFVVDDRQFLLKEKGEKLPFSPSNGRFVIDGVTYSFHTSKVTGMKGADLGAIAVGLSTEDLSRDIGKLKGFMLSMLAVSALLSYALAKLFIRALVSPLQTITAFIDKLAKGNLDENLDMEKGRDEISFFADNLRSMQKQLKAGIDMREEYTSRLEIAIGERTKEIKNMQEQLLQSQKMEAIGQLAGGIAHDFNNMLSVIIGYASMLDLAIPQGDRNKDYVQQVLMASERAGTLTRGLLSFSRKQIMQPRLTDLNGIIRNIEGLLKRVIGEEIQFSPRLSGNKLPIIADTGPIEQALINLCANARDAMKKNGGSLTIETGEISVSDAEMSLHGLEAPGQYALLTISDTGTGMDDETKKRIFEPFFTTKEVGKGTGLGLSMVYGIVRQHDAHITVDTKPGEGTTFKIYFSLASAGTAYEGDFAEQERLQGGTETILLAEDDAEVRKLTRTLLEEVGYTVIEALDGEEAINKFTIDRDRVDLIVLDVIMPKINGRAVYEKAFEMKPGIKALFVSGYTSDIIRQKGIIADNLTFISKPATPNKLLRKIREVLDS